MNNMVGLALVGVGIVLLIMGISAADSVSSSFSRFFTGNPSDRSIWLMLGGVACIVAGGGGFLYLRGRPKR